MNEDIKTVCDVKEKTMDLLRQANRQKEFSMGDVSFLHDAMSTIKKACEVKQMMEDEENGYSSANRGQHYVRGHYSRDDGRDGMDGNYSSRRDGRGRYSREDANSNMMWQLEKLLDSATEQQLRDGIHRLMRQFENA